MPAAEPVTSAELPTELVRPRRRPPWLWIAVPVAVAASSLAAGLLIGQLRTERLAPAASNASLELESAPGPRAVPEPAATGERSGTPPGPRAAAAAAAAPAPNPPPTEPTPARSPDALVSLGHVDATQGRLESADRLFEQALAQRPDDVELRLQVAEIYGQLGQHTKVWAVGQPALQQLVVDGKRRQAAVARARLGRWLRKGADPELRRAKGLLLAACHAGEPSATGCLELARLYRAQSRRNKALSYYRRALSVDRGLAVARAELRHLERRR